MNILVTGGNGFIGSHLVERYLQERHRPTIIDVRAKAELQTVFPHARSFILPAEDPHCEAVFADSSYDLVVHLACLPLPSLKSENFSKVLQANLAALGNILFLAHKFTVPKVIVLFDYRIYGTQQTPMIPEDSEPNPDCETGRQEVMREDYCEAYRRQGLQVVSLRTGIIYGETPSWHNDLVKQQILFQQGNDGTKQSGYNTSWQKNDVQQEFSASNALNADYLFIYDLIEAIIRVGENQTSPILNIGSGRLFNAAAIQAISKQICQVERSAIETEFSPVSRSVLQLLAEPEQQIAKNGNKSKINWTPVHIPALALNGSGGYCLDYSKAAFELEWTPKYDLVAGVRKTMQLLQREKDTSEAPKSNENETIAAWRQKLTVWLTKPQVENLALFTVTVLLSFWLNYRLGFGLDLLLLYVILINAFYGLRPGGMAIAVAILARLWFYLGVENISLFDFFNDANKPVYLAFYFIAGAVIGYINDKNRQAKVTLAAELAQSQTASEQTAELYASSLKVKNSLQAIIADTESGFSKFHYICQELDQTDSTMVIYKAARLISELLKTPKVAVYRTFQNEFYLRFISANGPSGYQKTINVSELTYFKPALSQHQILINREMQPGLPVVCAPLGINNGVYGLVFLDGVDFLQLNQHYLNTLRSLTQIVGFFIEKAIDMDQAMKREKYVSCTRILRKEHFARVMTEQKSVTSALQSSDYKSLLLRISSDSLSLKQINRTIDPLVRSIDVIGLLSDKSVGVLMANVAGEDAQTIAERLAMADLAVSRCELS